MQKQIKPRAYLVYCMLILTIYSCANSDSEDIRTSGIHATMTVTAAAGAGTEVVVHLTVGSGLGANDLDLSRGDELSATAQNVTQVLTRQNRAGIIKYLTQFDFNDSRTVVRVALNRADDSDAPNSYVTLPDVIEIISPSLASIPEFDASNIVEVVWTQSVIATRMSVTAKVQCVKLDAASIDDVLVFQPSRREAQLDSGVASFDLTSLVNDARIDRTQPCAGTMMLSRQNRGVLDPNFGEGGSIQAYRLRDFAFKLVFSTSNL